MEPVAVEFTLRDLGLGGKVVYEMGTSLEAVMGDVPMWAFSPDEIETSRQVPLASVAPKFPGMFDEARAYLAAAGVKERVFYLGMPI